MVLSGKKWRSNFYNVARSKKKSREKINKTDLTEKIKEKRIKKCKKTQAEIIRKQCFFFKTKRKVEKTVI